MAGTVLALLALAQVVHLGGGWLCTATTMLLWWKCDAFFHNRSSSGTSGILTGRLGSLLAQLVVLGGLEAGLQLPHGDERVLEGGAGRDPLV